MAIQLIIGLGNEGKEYEQTYHNIGAMAARFFQNEKKPEGVKFFHPPGFMNGIGVPVAQFLKQTPIKPEEVLVIHDDSDLAVGAYKLSFGAGSAGHKGVQSVIENLGTEKFWRLRIGVRRVGEQERAKAGEFVLKKIPAKEQEIFSSVFNQAWDEIVMQLATA